MTTRRSMENPQFSAARPRIREMRAVIRAALRAAPDMGPEDGAEYLFRAFVNEGLVDEEAWGEDLVYSLFLSEMEEMWASAQVV